MQGFWQKADKVGLTVDPALNQQLTSFDVAVKEARRFLGRIQIKA